MRAEFVIGESWRLLVHCGCCHRVTAAWNFPLPECIFQAATCWECVSRKAYVYAVEN